MRWGCGECSNFKLTREGSGGVGVARLAGSVCCFAAGCKCDATTSEYMWHSFKACSSIRFSCYFDSL